MKSPIVLVGIVALCAVIMTGCGSSDAAGEATAKTTYCGLCGHIAGSDDCCDVDAEACSCGMQKGSPLCCKLNNGVAAEAYCATCGHDLNGPKCCKDGCSTCDKCGMHEGSALCCKIE